MHVPDNGITALNMVACFEVLSPYDNEHDDMLHRQSGLEDTEFSRYSMQSLLTAATQWIEL